MTFIKNAFIVFISLLFLQCAKENQYLIKKGKVGYLTSETKIIELTSIFENDSVVGILSSNKDDKKEKLFSVADDEYLVFSKKGEKLLEISPNKPNDSLSKIRSIQIFDTHYTTVEGISLLSTFKDINEHYLVNKVETTLTSATLFVDELNATIAIDKKDLGLNSFSREEISIDQIPDNAKVTYFTIWIN